MAEQRGPNCLLMSILSPRRAGAAPLLVKDLSARRVFRAQIDCGPFSDTIIAALDQSLIQFPDVQGYTELALIRRDQTGKAIDCWTLGGDPIDVT